MKKGFTLIETMVAVSILALSIAGPLYTAGRAVVSAEISKDQLTSSYLAQEGIEYVRAMRDDAYLTRYGNNDINASADAWTDFTSGSNVSSIAQCSTTECTVDPFQAMGTGNGLSLEQCSGNACTPLFLSNGVYTQKSGLSGEVRTVFTRTIKATPISATEESITSTVSWKFHNTLYRTTVVDLLTRWQ